MSQNQKPTLSVIGPGLVGSALARALNRRGYKVSSVFSRRASEEFRDSRQITANWIKGLPAKHLPVGDILFITTPDEVIGSVAYKLRQSDIDWTGKSVVHCSGSLMSDSLAPLKESGAETASFHPIQTFADDVGEELFRDITVSIEGDEKLGDRLEVLAESLGARPVKIDSRQKRMLHIAAVFMSNYTVALSGIADKIIREGTGEGDYSILNPLLMQTARNITTRGLQAALTGPVSRGDVETVREHLLLLQAFPDFNDVYKKLGSSLLEILPDNNSIPEEKVIRLRELFLQEGSMK